jgi:hypothetical protein
MIKTTKGRNIQQESEKRNIWIMEEIRAENKRKP